MFSAQSGNAPVVNISWRGPRTFCSTHKYKGQKAVSTISVTIMGPLYPSLTGIRELTAKYAAVTSAGINLASFEEYESKLLTSRPAMKLPQ
jgi:hypothetical protein